MGTPRTAFDADFGTGQGRIKPKHWTPPDGDYVYQLGHDVPGVVRVFRDGNHHRITQSIDYTGATFLRQVVHLRPPRSMPAGATWQFKVDDFLPVILNPGDPERTLFDIVLPVAGLGAGNEVAYRLQLEAPAGKYEVELPGVYVDRLKVDTATSPRPILCNRLPEPGETQIPLATALQFVVADPLLSDVDQADAYVQGVLVASYIGGTVTPIASGWTGVGFAGSGFAIVQLFPPAAFPPLTVVTVRVVATLHDGTTLDASYSFTTADTIAPVIASALAPDELSVEVVFDEPVKIDAASAALTPSSYQLAAIDGLPAVTPLVVSVEATSDRAVVLHLDRIMTRGATYELTVSGVVDLFDNVIAAPGNATTFIGYEWPVPDGRSTSLFGMLPEHIRVGDESGTHRRFLGVPQEILDTYYGLADRMPQYIDPDFAPEPWVDLMLSDLGNPFDFLDLDEAEKRLLAQTLVSVYRTKGTGPGLVSAVRFFLGIDISLRVYAWAPYPIGQAVIGSTLILGSSDEADLYTFEVVVGDFLTEVERQHIAAIVEYMKVAHEHWRLVEPTVPVVIMHWQMGFSLLGSQTILHTP